jgi:hypothetical protein
MTRHLPTDTGPAAFTTWLKPIMQSWHFIRKAVKVATTVAIASPPVLHSPCALKRRSRSNLHPKTMSARIATAHWSNCDSVRVAGAATTFKTGGPFTAAGLNRVNVHQPHLVLSFYTLRLSSPSQARRAAHWPRQAPPCRGFRNKKRDERGGSRASGIPTRSRPAFAIFPLTILNSWSALY